MEEGEALALSKRMIPRMQGNIDVRIKNLYDVTDPDSISNHMIYVDNKVFLENQLTMDDLLKMADQPHKFRLSNYLRNKVIRERAKREQY